VFAGLGDRVQQSSFCDFCFLNRLTGGKDPPCLTMHALSIVTHACTNNIGNQHTHIIPQRKRQQHAHRYPHQIQGTQIHHNAYVLMAYSGDQDIWVGRVLWISRVLWRWNTTRLITDKSLPGLPRIERCREAGYYCLHKACVTQTVVFSFIFRVATQGCFQSLSFHNLKF
jgi:hypothetical protein